MITVERKLARIIPYKLIYFPSEFAFAELTQTLRPAEMARLFWSATALGESPRIVRHHLTRTVCIDLDRPLDVLWKGMDSKSCRYSIRRAEKLGDRVRITRNAADAMPGFLALFNAFARAKTDGVSVISEQSITRFGPNTDIFLAELDGHPLCGHVLLRDATIGRARLLFSCNRRLEDPETARLSGNVNRLLHWHEIRAYKQDGFSLYDFGGIDQRSAPGIAEFKASFGGRIVVEHTYLCAGTPWLGQIVQSLFETFSPRGRRWRPMVEHRSV